MKNRFVYFIIAFVISFEFLILLIGLLLWIFNINFIYVRVSEVLLKNSDLKDIVIQIGIPLAVLGLSFSQYSHILQPKISLKKFYSWPQYQELKDTFITGLIWNFLSVLMSLIVVFLLPNSTHSTKGALYLIPLVTSAFSTLTIIFARQRLKETIELSKDENEPST